MGLHHMSRCLIFIHEDRPIYPLEEIFQEYQWMIISINFHISQIVLYANDSFSVIGAIGRGIFLSCSVSSRYQISFLSSFRDVISYPVSHLKDTGVFNPHV